MEVSDISSVTSCGKRWILLLNDIAPSLPILFSIN